MSVKFLPLRVTKYWKGLSIVVITCRFLIVHTARLQYWEILRRPLQKIPGEQTYASIDTYAVVTTKISFQWIIFAGRYNYLPWPISRMQNVTLFIKSERMFQPFYFFGYG